MCGVKLIDRKSTKELMQILRAIASIKKMLKAAAVRWNRHFLRQKEGSIMKEALTFEVIGKKNDKTQNI